jgi:hypothetical protein
MEKKLLYSYEEYFAYCEQNQIGYISRTYGSQCCNIEDGTACNDVAKLYKGINYVEWLQINNKPSHYPCILVYYKGVDDVIRGMFIYPEDFKD